MPLRALGSAGAGSAGTGREDTHVGRRATRTRRPRAACLPLQTASCCWSLPGWPWSPSSSSRMGGAPAPVGLRSLDRSCKEPFSRLLRRHTELLWKPGVRVWASTHPLAHPPGSALSYRLCLLPGGTWVSGPLLCVASFWLRSCGEGQGCRSTLPHPHRVPGAL